MTHFRRVRGAFALILLMVAGCSPTEPGQCGLDTQPSVTVAEEFVEFSWEDCVVRELTVRNSRLDGMWTLHGKLSPPIRYGKVPSGAVEPAGPATPLEEGEGYTAQLAVDGGESTLALLPEVEFVR